MTIHSEVAGIIRQIHAGGLTRSEIVHELQANSILMNPMGEQLLASDIFTTTESPYSITTIELTVRGLGLSNGGTTVEIYDRAAALDLLLCPLEIAPHMRLQYRDQEEGHSGKPVRQHRAPYGSITIASPTIAVDDDLPNGFYLRRIEGKLWLRGCYSPREHVWDADDHMVFMQSKQPDGLSRLRELAKYRPPFDNALASFRSLGARPH